MEVAVEGKEFALSVEVVGEGASPRVLLGRGLGACVLT